MFCTPATEIGDPAARVALVGVMVNTRSFWSPSGLMAYRWLLLSQNINPGDGRGGKTVGAQQSGILRIGLLALKWNTSNPSFLATASSLPEGEIASVLGLTTRVVGMFSYVLLVVRFPEPSAV